MVNRDRLHHEKGRLKDEICHLSDGLFMHCTFYRFTPDYADQLTQPMAQVNKINPPNTIR